MARASSRILVRLGQPFVSKRSTTSLTRSPVGPGPLVDLQAVVEAAITASGGEMSCSKRRAEGWTVIEVLRSRTRELSLSIGLCESDNTVQLVILFFFQRYTHRSHVQNVSSCDVMLNHSSPSECFVIIFYRFDISIIRAVHEFAGIV